MSSIGPREAALRAMREARVTKTVTRPAKVSVTRRIEAIINRGGRPKKANALTAAQKQRAYRERKKAANG